MVALYIAIRTEPVVRLVVSVLPSCSFASWLRVIALAAVLPLAGCGAGPSQTYDLTALPQGQAVRAPRGQLIIYEPVASAPADTDRIIVRPLGEAVATLKGAQWREPLPRLVQTRLVQSFENRKLVAFVGRPNSRLVARYALNSEIRRFEMDVVRGEAVVEIAVKLIDEGSGRILAGDVFSAAVPAQASADQAPIALDQALQSVMDQIITFTTRRF
jgi:cholesterol transport system auxiliary component